MYYGGMFPAASTNSYIGHNCPGHKYTGHEYIVHVFRPVELQRASRPDEEPPDVETDGHGLEPRYPAMLVIVT